MQAISEEYRIDRGFLVESSVTLDELIREGSAPDLYRMAQDLFTALEFVNAEMRWFSDISEVNIFCTKSGRFSLRVPNNTLARSVLPDTAIFASNDYWMPVFAYLIGRVRLTELNPGQVPGILFNYLQVVFIVLRVRLALVDEEGDYDSPALFEQLPIILDKVVPEFRQLFTRLLTKSNKMPRPSDLEQIKTLFIEKIVRQMQEAEVPPRVMPVIRRFECDRQDLNKGDSLEFSWEVDHAESILLFRNGQPYKESEQGTDHIRLTEAYDETVATISYSLYACNNQGYVYSQLLLKTERRKSVFRPLLPLPVALVLAMALTLSVWLWSGL